MSTTHAQPGLSSDQRSNIRSTILSTRHTLEDELRRQLEKYGIYKDKKLPQDELTHLSAEELHTRDRIDAAIERELESTEGDLERSITNYVREATKTHLNRFVALKTIEVRGLVEETITERPEYGNRSYMHHTVAEIAGELTNAPDDGFGAALDLAYQEIGAEIRMIFEESEHTAIDLDAQAREEILNELDGIDDEAWESDEALGWVYQYFGEEERKDIDKRVDEENYKVAGTDIATKTQLFTPRYIVEWMVDNSLGRTWLEMYGGVTDIDGEDNCFYLTPLEDSLQDREPRSAENITVLDPACGSGHMLLYAFDVLYEMYLERGEVPETYIPREILRNNLYGIDIDSGAAQIAALSLYLKAKEKSPDVTIPRLNIASADAVLVNGDRKNAVLNRAETDLEREILEQIWRSFDNIRELGSLIQVEERIDDLLEEHREEFAAQGQAQFTQDGEVTAQSTFVSGGHEDSWEGLKQRLMQNVRALAREGLEQNDLVEEMFANEVEKTVELLDLLIDEYDVVVSNPPYLQSKKMGENLKKYVRSNYEGKTDVYGAFIERCLSFTNADGYSATITPANFMFLYYWRGMRKKLLNESNFIEALHLSDRDEAYMNIASVATPLDGEPVDSRFSRIVEADDKLAASESVIQNIRDTGNDDRVYVFSQKRIEDIGRRPFLYWFGEEILSMFSKYESLKSVADLNQGLSTSNDKGLVKKWWELPDDTREVEYVRFQKSGTNSEYYDYPQDYVIWYGGRSELEENGANFRNEELYFKEGVTFRRFGSYFVGRKHYDDGVFSDKAIFTTSDELSDELLLSHYNSTLFRYVANGLNPGLNFELGDANRFPVKTSFKHREQLESLASLAVENREQISAIKEISSDYNGELVTDCLDDNPTDLLAAEEAMQARILVAQGLSDTFLFDEYDISPETRSQLYENLPGNTGMFPVAAQAHVEIPDSVIDHIDVEEITDKEIQAAVETLESMDEPTLREAAEETTLSPLTVAALRAEHNLYTDDERTKTAGRIASLILGALFDRWDTQRDLPSIDDEVLAFNNGNSNIESLIGEAIDSLFRDSVAAEQALSDAFDQEPVQWLQERFFRHHHVAEYKPRGERSPIYWQLESPEGTFSCYVYYHGVDENTLPRLRGQYLDPRIAELENELETLTTQTSGEDPDNELLKRKEKVQNDLDDIREFRETVDEMIDDGVTVDVEKGIWENIKEWDQYEVLETGLPKLKSSYSR